MGWLIVALALVLLGGLAMFTRWGRRQAADETPIAGLLPPEPPAVRVLPAPQPQEEDEPPPAPAAQPAAEGGWLETQLAEIAAWSERMQKQIASSAADPDPQRCTATTKKGNQCKLPAEPGDTKCAIHGGRAHLQARASAPAGHVHHDCCH